MRLVFAAVAAFLLVTPVRAQESGVKTERDIPYGKGGDVELKLNLAMPAKGDGPFPAVVCVHGGGWRGGQRESLDKLTELLAKNGYVAVTVSYRLTPKHPFPAQIEDCKAAVRWLRANAKKYHVNPDRIGAVGFSAGGHLVSLLGAADATAVLEGKGGNPDESSRVQAVVSFFGPTDFTVKRWDAKVEDFFLVPFFGGTFADKQAFYRKGSPIAYVTKDDPPFLFFHGGKDTLVGLHHSQDMAEKLRAAGVPATLRTLPDEGHGWAGPALDDTLRQTIRFFDEKLKGVRGEKK
jgi:acetyl esterase/lipase